MNNEQLAVWLSNHPRLMETDYQHDIQKLKGIVLLLYFTIMCTSTHLYQIFFIHKINIEVNMDGYTFLTLDKGSLEQFGLSAQFRTPLMIIIEEMV